MIFNSRDFLLFFPIVVSIYGIIPRRKRYIWLLIASYFFYMCWNVYYIALIIFSTSITYIAANVIEGIRDKKDLVDSERRCRIWVVAATFINLMILAVFKYWNWFWGSISSLLHMRQDLSLSILLPVGISFYTFQALGYLIDVYRGDVKAEKNFLRYALFVSFFPQLVAGPIERSKNLLHQVSELEHTHFWDHKRITMGLVLMIWGLFQKMVIADRVAILVDEVFDHYAMYGSIELAIAAIGFAIQIYCDFSSYSTIAVGAARVFGVELMDNFSVPYFSRSIKEFWRRWHISLSAWFKDYVYIPLGGNRCSRSRNDCNILITFLVSGLWHGADWKYVIWGGLHGVFQIIGKRTYKIRQKIDQKIYITESFSYRLGQALVTFCLVDIAWIFFRASDISSALRYIYRLSTRWDPWVLFDGSLYRLGLDVTQVHILLMALLALYIISRIKYKSDMDIDEVLSEQCLWFRWAVILMLIFSIIIFGVYGPGLDSSQFIYFQF